MNILLLGNTGQLGWELHRSLLPLGEITAFDYPQIDMANLRSIQAVIKDTKPDIIINATAYTDVDKAESEPELAQAINATGPGILAEEAQKRKAAIIHFSTDYVFDGTKGSPYTENDQPNPLGAYGKTKLAGEQAVGAVEGAHLIFRTSWVYSLRRPCFVTKALQWARKNQILRIVDDQISSPTWARTLAEATSQLIAQSITDPIGHIKEISGLYHLSEREVCSRYEWAKAILKFDPNKDEQVFQKLLPAKSSDFPTPVERPKYSALDCCRFEQTFSLYRPNWRETLKLVLN